MGILSGNPQEEPLHYGEVFVLWTHLLTNNGAVASYQTLINHTGDDDLKKLLDESIQGMKSESEQISEVLKANGVALPPTPPERPSANLEEIPAGARFNDPEISAILSVNSAQGLVACSQAMGQSIREDIAMMYGQFHTARVTLGAKILKLNKSKGWIIPPPLQVKTSENK